MHKQSEKVRDLFDQPVQSQEKTQATSKGGKRKMVKLEVTANTAQPLEEEQVIGREEAKQVVREMMKEKTNKKQNNRPQTSNKPFVKDDFPSFAG